MKDLRQLKSVFIITYSVLAGCASFAQAKLNVNGAKVNIAPSIFLSTNDVSVNGTILTVSGSTLKVANSINSASAIDITNGTLEMNGAADQQIPPNSLSANTIKNLTISGNGDVTVGGPLALTDVLTLSGGSLTSPGTLTLKSVSTKTARVAPVTTPAPIAVHGDVIVERYISSRRAFRFLTAPVNSATNIRANWMENTNNPSLSVNNNPVPNYGTHITGYGGNANGFDVTASNNPSLYTFNNQTQAWLTAVNTNGTFHAGGAYRIMVRGSRSTDIRLTAPPSSVTTLRAKGVLTTGTVVMKKPGAGGTPGMPELTATPLGYNLLGNPYASPIDWQLLERNDLASTIYIWDATLNGTNGRGEYVSYNPNTGVSNISSLVDNNLQSGQAFFVQSTGSNPSLTIRESHKTAFSRAVFRTGKDLPHMSVQLLLPGQDTAGGAADGLCAYFSRDFNSGLGDEDSYKFTNLDENIAILRNGRTLSIEGRPPVSLKDTLPLKVWQLVVKNYKIKAVISNFMLDTDTYLEDDFLHTSTKLKNNGTTLVPVSITKNPLSAATNRFRIVFRGPLLLPVTLSDVKAYVKNAGVQVEWTAQSENDMDRYEVERSTDAQHFVTAGTVKANATQGITTTYNWFDETPEDGDNYYRIKSISKTGEITYSAIVKVNITRKAEATSMYANANGNNSIRIQLNHAAKGDYNVMLINGAGQKLYSGTVSHPGGSAANTIRLTNLLPGGIYHLQMSIAGQVYNASLIMP